MRNIRDVCEFTVSLLGAFLFGAAFTALVLTSPASPRVDATPIVGVASPRSSKWPAVRNKYLAEHPECAVCGHNKDLNVHHVKPFAQYPELELDPRNFITLGVDCPTGNHHLLFGHLGSYLSHNPDVRKDAEEWRSKIQNRPPPAHHHQP